MWRKQGLVRQSPSMFGRQVWNDERSPLQPAYEPAMEGLVDQASSDYA